MDPTAAFDALIRALDEAHTTAHASARLYALEDARDHAQALVGWIDRGGFAPKPERDGFGALMLHVQKLCEAQVGKAV